jgi:hypothetical protein
MFEFQLDSYYKPLLVAISTLIWRNIIKISKNFVSNFLVHVENYKLCKSEKLSDYVINFPEIIGSVLLGTVH